MKGLFITFEGLDGSGKTTQIALLADYLKRKGREVITTIEPGGTTLGDRIRQILLDKNNAGMSHKAETFLFEASRAELVSKVIAPALDSGKIIICDRFFDSTIAYQGIARGLGAEKVMELSLWATDGIVPDLTFLLSVDVEGGEKRLSGSSKNRDRIESEEEKFKQRIFDGYIELARKYSGRIVLIDARQKIKTIFNQIRERVDRELDKL
ncbi:MAG: dTMP kinase [Actinomycetota bacterium]|nr:MAG: dTMP kinase [Actinomycetota bacterium]